MEIYRARCTIGHYPNYTAIEPRSSRWHLFSGGNTIHPKNTFSGPINELAVFLLKWYWIKTWMFCLPGRGTKQVSSLINYIRWGLGWGGGGVGGDSHCTRLSKTAFSESLKTPIYNCRWIFLALFYCLFLRNYVINMYDSRWRYPSQN